MDPDELTEEELQWVREHLESTGACMRLDDEALLDGATALSGTGPGYIFYIVEHMLAEREPVYRRCATQVLDGSLPPEQLADQVEAALRRHAPRRTRP